MSLGLRPAARALIIAPGPQVLLVRFRFGRLRFWAPPGGGLEGSENHEQALHRELAEEVGLVEPELGPVVYVHERAYFGVRGGQRDVVHRVDVAAPFEPRPQLSPEQLQAEHVDGFRWFSVDALRRVHVLPYDLADIVARLGESSGPLALDDLLVPPVVVAVSGSEPLARRVAQARMLPLGAADGDRVLALARGHGGAMKQALGRRRVQVVRVEVGGSDPSLDGLCGPRVVLREGDLKAALSTVDLVLPARG